MRLTGPLLAILTLTAAPLAALGQALPEPSGAATRPAIVSAAFEDRTGRYGHDVLGGNEFARMDVVVAADPAGNMTVNRIDLPGTRVFEDIQPRLTDLDGDGFFEIVVVESDFDAGARLVVYGLEGEGVRVLAQTPPIGRPFRWLSPAGIADFSGDGTPDIAYVETPHIGGTLRFWSLRSGSLVQIASAFGFSNHRIGQDFITGGARNCGQGFEVVTPSMDWSRLLAVRLQDDRVVHRTIADKTDPMTVQDAMACRAGF